MSDEFFCQAHNDCSVDLSNFIINCTFITVCFGAILWKISRDLSLLSTKQNARFDEHNCRWILFIILFLICLAEIGDAFIVASDTQVNSYSLKIPAIFSLLAALTAAYFYTKMEKWNQLQPMFILLVYWPFVLASKIYKLGYLYHSHLDSHHSAVTITFCYLVVYLLSFLIEINLIWTNKYLSSWQSIALPLNDPPDTQYRRPWVSLPSKATFYWMNALILRGLKRPITQQCLGSLAQECQVQGHFNKLKEIYSSQSDKGTKNTPLWKCLVIVLWRPMLFCGLFKLIADVISLIAPLAVGIIISYVVDYSHRQSRIATDYVTVSDFLKNGYVMATVVLLSSLTGSVFTHNLIHLTSLVAIRARCLVQMLVYEKSLKLSVWPKETQVADSEEIHCLATDDADNLMQFVLVFHHIWSFLFKLIVVTILIYLQLGYGAFIGVFVSIIFLLPAQFQLRKIMEKSQTDQQKIKKGRLRRMEEFLLKMLCLKMNSWEILYANKIHDIRKRESRLLILINLCWWLHDVLNWTAYVLMSIVAFAVYTSAEREILTPQAAFTAVALFQQILFALFMSPVLISVPINAVASLKRLQSFLETTELSEKKFSDSDKEGSTVLEFEDDSGSVVDDERARGIRDTEIFLNDSDEDITGDADAAIQLDDASFSWDKNNKEPVLQYLSVDIPYGKITLVCSRNRRCERAFLLALLGELHTVHGSILWTRNSPIAFVPMMPWFQQQTSIRDNILFLVPYDAQRYNRIITACGLQGEFDQWFDGDLSLIGDVELSMSQKHRISIARALYSKCKTIILDDVFSSMDSALSLLVFEEGFKKFALQYRRTVIAVSRQMHILPMGDLIVVLDNETIKFQGNWKQLQEWDPDLESTLIPNSLAPNDETEKMGTHFCEKSVTKPALKIANRGVLQMMGIHLEDKSLQNTTSNADASFIEQPNTSELKDESFELDDSSAPVLKPETKKDDKKIVPTLNLFRKGILSLKHVLCFFISFIALSTFTHIFLVLKDNLLAHWSDEWNKRGEDEYSGKFLTHYNVMSIMGILFFCGFSVLTAVAINFTCTFIHNSIIDAALSFTNYTKAKIDNLMNALRIHFAQIDETTLVFCHYFWIGTWCVVIIFVTFRITLFMFPLFILFALFIYSFQRLYSKFYRNVYSLLSTSVEQVVTHLTETLKGLVLIRSFREEKNVNEKLFDLLDKNQLMYLIVDSARRWMELVLDLSLSILIFVITLIAVHAGVNGHISPGIVGFALVYILMLPICLKWLIYAWPEVRSDANSLKILEPYTRISSANNEGTMIDDWPSVGKIQVENLSVPPVMNGVSFVINPGEKVGIYDRNGSDLSFLAQMFVRLMPVPEETILIDDTDISKALPTLLRLTISVISKDDCLFTDTIRNNLDMRGKFDDDKLWTALEIFNFKSRVSKLTEGLDHELSSDSKIFKNNESSLLCLTRAILHNHTKIFITNELDSQVLKRIIDLFPNCTTIALSSDLALLDACDRILELEDGRIVG